MIQLQIPHGLLEILPKLLRSGTWRDLRLHDHFFTRQARENPAELHFAGAVSSCGFDVIDAKLQRAKNGGFEIALPLFLDDLGRKVVPRLLKTHPAAGKNWHLQIGAAKAAVAHGCHAAVLVSQLA